MLMKLFFEFFNFSAIAPTEPRVPWFCVLSPTWLVAFLALADKNLLRI
jgi:hypothetical protein